jgi:uncharacterized protein YjdB
LILTRTLARVGLVGFALALLAARPAVAQQIERITVQPSTVEIGIGEVVLLTAIATFSDGSTANISELVEWTSSGPGVARVSNRRGSKGRVTARATGQASISVRDTVSGVSSGQSGGNAIVAVLGRLTALQVEPVDRRIEVGDSRNFRAIGTFSSGATRDVTPFVAWTSDNPNIARVSDDPSTRGRVTAVAPGVAIISVRSATGVDSTDSNGDARVRVPAELVSLRILPATNDVPVGIRLSLDAEGTFNDATLDDVSNDVVWTSSNPAVAVVSNIEGSFGEVTALADGVTVISVVDLVTGVSSTASGGDAIVTVAGMLASIRLDPLEDSLPTGLTRTFSAQGVLDNGMTFNLSRRDVQWLAANPAVASISNDPATAGTLTGVAKGVTTVSAVHLPTGVRAEQDATITVLGRMIGLAVRPRLRELFSGQQDRFNAFALLDDGAEFRLSRDLQWVSSNDAVATISNVGGQRGQVTGNTKGECTVSVSHLPTGFSSSSSSSDGRVLVRGRVETVRIDPPRAFYVLGTEPRIRARAGFDDGSTENIRSDVLWSTSDATVAIVGNEAPKKGILQSFKVGQVTISAIEPVSGVSTTATGGDGVAIIVDGLQRLRVPAPEGADQMRTGDFFRLRALGTFPNPVPAAGEAETVDVDISEFVEFTSSDPNVIRIDAGRVLAVGLGTAKVTARDPRTGILSSQTPEGDATFTVIAALQRMKVKPGMVRTRVGSRKRIGFTAIGYYSDRAKIEITDKVTFGTADAGIATISNENTRHGLVVPVGPGNTSAFATEPITGIIAPSRRIVVKGGGKGRAR